MAHDPKTIADDVSAELTRNVHRALAMIGLPKDRERSSLVRGYVRAVRRHQTLRDRLAAKDEALRPLRNKVAVAAETVRRKYGRLNGRQIAAAERLLREDSTPVKESAP